MPTPKRFITNLLSSLALLLLISSGPALAVSKTPSSKTPSQSSSTQKTDLSSGVTRSYNADPSVQLGMIVELKTKSPDTVVPLPNKDIQSMLGVVIPASSATIVLTPQKVSQQQVLVATSGQYGVLVSNQNGPVKVGDFITISAINGIGMKASDNELEVIGKAAGNFSGTASVIGSVKLKDLAGHDSTIAIGRIPVDLNITHNPLFQKSADYVPGFLAKAAVAVASHPVSVARIYLSMAILLCAALLTGNTMYSGIRSGMIAVGRNPLSKKSIIRSLIQTVIAGLIIFVAGVFAVYLLLKL